MYIDVLLIPFPIGKAPLRDPKRHGFGLLLFFRSPFFFFSSSSSYPIAHSILFELFIILQPLLLSRIHHVF